MKPEKNIYKKPFYIAIASAIFLLISIILVVFNKSLVTNGGLEALYILIVLPLLFLSQLIIIILSTINLVLINKKREMISNSSRKSLSLCNVLYFVIVIVELIIIYI